jgi:hypothetical protein
MNTQQVNIFDVPKGKTANEKICETFIEWYRTTPPSMRRYLLDTLGPVGLIRQIRDKMITELRSGAIDRIVVDVSPDKEIRPRDRFFEHVPPEVATPIRREERPPGGMDVELQEALAKSLQEPSSSSTNIPPEAPAFIPLDRRDRRRKRGDDSSGGGKGLEE